MSRPRIILWAGRSQEPWAPPSIDAGGIGGSETAVIKIAERFQRAGWRVDVFNDAERYEGEHNGVGYWDCSRLRTDEACDVLVVWRRPEAHDLPIKARARLLWLHDLHYGPEAGEHVRSLAWDKVLGVSAWHAGMLRRYYDLERVGFVPNGIDVERFAAPVKKVNWRCVYGSSPDRGLDRLLDLWPNVLRAEPEATLHVAYGWQGLDARIAAGDQNAAAYKAHLERKMAETPGVTWRGRLGQAELATMFGEAWLWVYPTSFLETSCITAMQAMAAGAVPVCSSVGALKETVGEGGVLLPDHPDSRTFPGNFSRVVTGLLIDAGARLAAERKGRERAPLYSWDRAFEVWQRHVDEALNGSARAATITHPAVLHDVDDGPKKRTRKAKVAA